MRKTKLTSDYTLDFELVGIVSSLKEYKLAWHLNQIGIFHLVKGEDIKIEFSGNREVRISNLFEETEFTTVHLLRNKLISTTTHPNHYLINELQQFDFLLKLKNQMVAGWADSVVSKIKETNQIDYVMKIDVENLKSFENLLF